MILYMMLSCFLSVALINATDLDVSNSNAVQETLNSTEEAEVAVYPVERLEEKWSNKLASKGKSIGVLNNDGSIYVIGSHVAAKSPGDRGFTESRTIAYARAELNAKMQIVRMMNEALTSSRSSEIMEDMISGEDPDAKTKASKLDKASKVVDKSLDKALIYLGVEDEEISKMNEEKKEAIYQEKYYSYSRSLAAGSINGCGIVATSEGTSGNSGYQMAVLMKYAPELRELSAIVRSGKIKAVPKGKARNSIEKLKSVSTSKLISNLGARVMYDNEGFPMIVGFGQNSYEAGGRREAQNVQNAQQKARKQAVQAIKDLIAESIVVDETMERIEKLSEFEDGTEEVFSNEKWNQKIDAKRTEVDISGTMTLRKWKAIHPLTDSNIAGVIVYWSMDNTKMTKNIQNENFDKTDKRVKEKTNNRKSGRDGYLDDEGFFDEDDF